jgi:hypothetical protein
MYDEQVSECRGVIAECDAITATAATTTTSTSVLDVAALQATAIHMTEDELPECNADADLPDIRYTKPRFILYILMPINFTLKTYRMLKLCESFRNSKYFIIGAVIYQVLYNISITFVYGIVYCFNI